MEVANLTVNIRTNAQHAERGISRLNKSVRKFSNGAKHASKSSKGLISQLARIAKMRALRAIIKSISSAFTEGLNNAVAFSRTINGSMAKALDGLSSNALVMKNQLGSALGELLTTLSPIINSIISMITKAANALSQFFALLGGRSTYLKAGSDAVDQWGDSASSAGSAAKEWKNQLMGFDEINKLDDTSSSSGGSSSSSDFGSGVEASLDGFWADIKSYIDNGDFRYAGELLAEKLNGIIADLDLKGFGQKIGDFITDGLEMGLGFIKTFDFKTAGKKMMSFFTGLFDTVSAEDLGELITSTITGALEFINGASDEFNEGGLGAKIGEWFGNLLNGGIAGIDFSTFPDTMTNLLQGLVDALDSFIDTVDWSAFSDDFLGGLLEALLGASGSIWGTFLSTISELINGSKGDVEEDGEDVGNGFLEGVKNVGKGIGGFLKEHIVDPFVDNFEGEFEINSPSKVMKEEGEYLISGLENGLLDSFDGMESSVDSKWETFKKFWQGLSLPEIKLKMPHITVGSRPASGWIADVLNAFGITPNIPTIHVDWYAKGGIVDGATLIGAGEAGKEAIVPLENNTEWIDKVAEKVAMSIVGQGSSDSNVYVYLDGKQLSDSVTKWQRKTNRALGVNA